MGKTWHHIKSYLFHHSSDANLRYMEDKLETGFLPFEINLFDQELPLAVAHWWYPFSWQASVHWITVGLWYFHKNPMTSELKALKDWTTNKICISPLSGTSRFPKSQTVPTSSLKTKRGRVFVVRAPLLLKDLPEKHRLASSVSFLNHFWRLSLIYSFIYELLLFPIDLHCFVLGCCWGNTPQLPYGCQ